MISNEFAVKLCLEYKKGILSIYHDLITFNDDSGDELYALLASIDVSDLLPLDITDIPPFVCNMGKSARNKNQPSKNYKMSYNGEGPSLTINRPLTREELSREELEKDLYDRILIFSEKRPIIETLKYSDQHKKLVDSVRLDKLKLDGELEVEEEIVNVELIRGYKAIREKNDPGVFVLPIRLEGKFDFHALADTGSNINVMPYRIYVKLGREQVNPFYVANVRNAHAESDNDDEEEYCLKRDEMGKPIYGPNHAKYLSFDDPMDRALALQEALNPLKNIYVWKKVVALLGSLLVPLQNAKWIPNCSGNFAKENGDGQMAY
ncbi:hypothetical protein Tco_0780578 [Tanacetum coccineum]